jgi:hypothetical protein
MNFFWIKPFVTDPVLKLNFKKIMHSIPCIKENLFPYRNQRMCNYEDVQLCSFIYLLYPEDGHKSRRNVSM